MVLLQIEHPVPVYNAWKSAFDCDPVHRIEAGVRRYATFRPIDDPNYVIIHLEFDQLSDASALLATLHKLWERVEGKIILNPKTRIVEMLDNEAY